MPREELRTPRLPRGTGRLPSSACSRISPRRGGSGSDPDGVAAPVHDSVRSDRGRRRKRRPRWWTRRRRPGWHGRRGPAPWPLVGPGPPSCWTGWPGCSSGRARPRPRGGRPPRPPRGPLAALKDRSESAGRRDRRSRSPRSRSSTGLSRKYVIPLLEYLDRERVTRRAGNDRAWCRMPRIMTESWDQRARNDAPPGRHPRAVRAPLPLDFREATEQSAFVVNINILGAYVAHERHARSSDSR